MPQPYDYGGLMAQSARLTDIYPGIQEALLGQQTLQANAMKLEQERQAMAQQQAMQADLSHVLSNPSPQAIGAVMMKYPSFSKQIGEGWSTYDTQAKQSKLKLNADVVGYLQSGDTAGAANILRQHMEADQAAGHDISDYQQLFDIIQHNPKQALGLAMLSLASGVGPDKFAETYKAINPTEHTSPTMREYNDRVAQFGKAAADQWLTRQDTKLIPVPQGGSVYADGPTTSTAEGGDQSTGAGDPPTILKGAKESGTITEAEAATVRKSMGANGQAAFQKWLTDNGIKIVKGAPQVQSSKTVGGVTYYQIGGLWYDNPEGK